MSKFFLNVLAGLLLALVPSAARTDDKTPPTETVIAAPQGLEIRVRMQGPYDAEVPLQVVCYFEHKAAGDTTLGAAVELDKRLGGVIAALRNTGRFAGHEMETLLLSPPQGKIGARQLLLIGLGSEETLSLERMEAVGRTAAHEAARLGISRVGFAPLIRDQGNSKFDTGDVGRAVMRGVLLAYDTEKRLQAKGFAPEYTLQEWIEEAGPMYFDATVTGARNAVQDAESITKSAAPL